MSDRETPLEFRKLIGLVRGRLALERFLAGIHDCLVVSLVLVLLLVVVSKLTPAVAPVWWIVFTALGVGSLLGALVLARRGRLSDSAIAALIDERLELRDRFSTALHCAGRDDPFARAALDEALSVARDAENRRRLAREFAPRAPGGSWVAPLIGVIAFVLWFSVPAGDVFASTDEEGMQAADEERLAVEDTIRTVLDQIEENPELNEELGDVANNFALDEGRPDGEMDSEEARREALRKVSELEQRLDELVNGEKGKEMDAMERALSEMEDVGDGDARELSQALKDGDFSKAQEALEKIEKELAEQDMTDEQRAELAEQLKEMAEQLKKASENKDALKDALKRAGLDPALANNPEALKQAMQQAGQLNEQQMQQLQNMAKAQQSANSSCKNMSDAMSQMAQQCQQGQPGASQGQQMQQMLSQADQMQQMLMQAKSAQGQCQGNSASSLGQNFASMLPSKPQPGDQQQRPPGNGFGSQPNGGGTGNAPIQETKFGTRLQKEQVALQEGGDVISRQLIESSNPVVGESTVEIQATADRIIRGWEEGARDELVPAHRREGVKGYLGELTRRLNARRRAETSGDTEGAAPAGETGDAPAETEAAPSGESTQSE
ncbi:MAG: hypothetical protein MK082_06065 [Phycisphaerales bacterium]|nr:hypothetical protein [Phycisphaerales bacterium]